MSRRTNPFLHKFLFYSIMVFLCLEVALRILGYQHFRNDDYFIQSTPINAFVGHSKLGIALNPGSYSINLNGGLKFTTRHLADHSRQVVGRKKDALQVFLLGCSFTYGYGVSGEQNFASQLQKKYRELGVHNGGVPGYGSVQSLMQLQERLDSPELKVVLLHFSSFHFMRNNLSQQYRSNLKIGYQRSSQHVDNLMQHAKFPYKISCNAPIEWVSWASMYANWPGRDWLAAVNWIQTSVDKASEHRDEQLEVTVCLLEEMNELCRQKGITFGVVCLDSTPETIQLKARLNDLHWLDIYFDFKSEHLTNHPYDSHPNPRGHQLIADKIEPFLGDLLYEN